MIKSIDQIDTFEQFAVLPFHEEAAKVALHLGYMSMAFARVERVPRYDETSRENDAEHSFMLSLVASELAGSYFSNLDPGLVAQFATVHDLVELETEDVATFTIDDATLAAKTAAEHSALDRVAQSLPAYTRQLFLRYEEQVEPEARFVRLVDKILPVIVDIAGPGRKVMEEDYSVTTVNQLTDTHDTLRQRFADMFPEKELDFLHNVRNLLCQHFEHQFALLAEN